MELTIDPIILGIHAAIFVAVMLLLNKLMFRPFVELLKAREARIDGNHKEAATLLEQAREAIETYETRIATARTEANQVRLASRAEAKREQEAILAAASEAGARQVEEIRARIGAELTQARQSLRADAEHMSRDLAARILGRSIG